MKIIHGIRNLNKKFKNPVVTIGSFDGVHLGHRKILVSLVKRAKRINGTSVVITFDPHPARVLRPKNSPPLLISLEHRIRLIEASGVDVILIIQFTRAFARLNAGDFVKKVLVGRLGAKEVLVGKGFAFGRNKFGKGPFLRRLNKKYGIRVTEVSQARGRRQPISSTRIRRLITKGNIREASQLLARRVCILGTVRKGVQRGRILGFRTANIDPHHEAIPPSGVYAVTVKVGGKMFGGVLNIGRRPTFYKYSDPTVEVHIFRFKGSIYNKDIEVGFIKKLRDEKRFSSQCALVSQIRLDEKKAKKTVSRYL